MTATRLRPSALAVVLCALGMVLAPVGPASSEPACAHMTQKVMTFKVTAGVPKKAYSVGQVIPVTITVTRPGEKDPAGEGQPIPAPVGLPVEDAGVTLGLYPPTGFPIGKYGTTNENGKVVLKVKAVAKLRRGFDLEARAEKRYLSAPAGCVDPVEEGTVTKHDPFTVR